jgi:hypothetical protein
MEATDFLTENKRGRDERIRADTLRAGEGKGWRHALEPKVARVMDWRLPTAQWRSKRMQCVLSKPCPQAFNFISLFLSRTENASH